MCVLCFIVCIVRLWRDIMESFLFVIGENIRIIFYVIDFGLIVFLIKWMLWGYVYLEVKYWWKLGYFDILVVNF